MFTKDDESFPTLVADAVQRQAAIASLTKARNRFGWITIALTVVNVVFVVCGEPLSGLIGLRTLTNGVFWIVVFKLDSDLKLLKAIDMLCAANKLPANDTKDAPKETPNTVMPAGAV